MSAENATSKWPKIKTKTIPYDPRKLRLLELNARYMRHETFQRLVQNIQQDGDLTSVPFCAVLGLFAEGDTYPTLDDGSPVLEVLSGNHRVQAAIAAGLTEIEIKVPVPLLTPIPKKRRFAIQLSHNAIEGQDDPAVLKAIFEAIDDVDLKGYSGLDDKALQLLEDVKPISISEANLEFQQLNIVFLPNELSRAQEVLDQARREAKGDAVWLTRMAEYDRWLDAVEAAGSAHGVKNAATAMAIILSVFENNLTSLGDIWANNEALKKVWVPFSTIFGTEKIPVEAARVIKRAVDKMHGAGDVGAKSLWRAVELWAADYLGEPHRVEKDPNEEKKAKKEKKKAAEKDAAAPPAGGEACR